MSATWVGCLAGGVDDLGDAGAQGALGVDAGEAEVVGGKGAEAFEGVVSGKSVPVATSARSRRSSSGVTSSSGECW